MCVCVHLNACICAYGCVLVLLQDFAAGHNANKVRTHKKRTSKWMSNCFEAWAPLWFSCSDEPCKRMCQSLESVINNYFKILHNMQPPKRPWPPQTAALTVSTISCFSPTSRVEYKWFCEEEEEEKKKRMPKSPQPVHPSRQKKKKNGSVRWHYNPRQHWYINNAMPLKSQPFLHLYPQPSFGT